MGGFFKRRNNIDEDFNDDAKDAGELGAGHTVTALYEVIPAGVDANLPKVDELKYQSRKVAAAAANSGEILTVKFRYKKPEGGNVSILMCRVLSLPCEVGRGSENLTFASAVAGFGMLLRDSKFKGTLEFGQVMELARSGKGKDGNGYKGEFIRLIERAELLKRGETRG